VKYFFTPEFHRNLWLRFSPFRLIAAPLIILLCFLTTSRLPKVFYAYEMTSTVYASLTIFYFVVIVWGAYEASTAMQEEIRGNTWDFQRMSSISPAQIAFGKLFGVTSYAWYFGLLALILFAYSYVNYAAPDQFYDGREGGSPFPEPDDDTLYVLFCLVASGVIAQAAAFLYGFADSMQMFGRAWRTKMPRAMHAFLVGAVAGSYTFFYTVIHDSVRLRPRAELMFHHVDIQWYGHDFPRHAFVVMSLLFFIGWLLVGAYRIARAELMYRCLPTVWMLFVATFVGWSSGFILRQSPAIGMELGTFHATMFGYMQAALIAYFALLTEASDSRRYVRFFYYVKEGNFLRAFENTPKWVATLPIVAFLFVAALSAASGVERSSDLRHSIPFMLSLMLFMARDGCAIHAIHLTFRGRGTGFALLFYYLVAYILLPMVAFTSIEINPGALFTSILSFKVPQNVGRVTGTFYPTGMTDASLSLVPVFVEAFVTAGWLAWCLKRAGGSANPLQAKA
jgi:hypothetical protein